MTLPYASGTVHEVVEILLQGFGEKEGWAINRLLAAQLARFFNRQHGYDPPYEPWRSAHRSRPAADERNGCPQGWLSCA